MSQYVSKPLSREDIRKYSCGIRKILHLENCLRFPIVEFFEVMPEWFAQSNFYTEIVEDTEMPPNIHAEYDLRTNSIRIKNSVYEGACAGSGRDRMTMAHEIGHFLIIRQNGVQLCRSFSEQVPTFQDPEWQAKCFAGELLIPAHLVHGMPSAKIAEECGVSLDAAIYQLGKIK